MKTKKTVEKLTEALRRKVRAPKELLLADSSWAPCQPVVKYYLDETGKFRSVVCDPCRSSCPPEGVHRSATSLDELIRLTELAIKGMTGCRHLEKAWETANQQAKDRMREMAVLRVFELASW